MNLKRIEAVILDLDGVVYLESSLIPGAARAIAALRRAGLRVVFATNNASMTRGAFAVTLSRLGIPCARADLMNAAAAAASLCRSRYPRGARLYAFGSRGVVRELRAAGFRTIEARTRAAWERFRRRPPAVRAAVVHFSPGLTTWTLYAAAWALRRGADLVACNLDSTYPVSGGQLPGTGSLVRLLQTATGRIPVLVGKPSPVLFRTLLDEHRLTPRRTLVVGDRIEIDVAAGRALGARTALVLTGVATRADASRARPRPDLVVRDLPALARRLGAA